jgi:hypothetical protein
VDDDYASGRVDAEEERAMQWIDQLAGVLGAEPLSEDEIDRLLSVARDVAHGVERKITPLASFLLGMNVERRMGDGGSRSEAMDAAIEELRATLPS